MGLILVRYGELGLKSRPVRMRFEKTLLRNIEDMFLREKEECLTSREWGRMMVHVRDDGKAGNILRRVFGITSFSPAEECTSDRDDIAKHVAERSKGLVKDGRSFAIRARRSGNHPYTSQELASFVGSAVWNANRDKKLKVDLGQPDVEIFIEVRQKKAFTYIGRTLGPGGLPLGTQGRVLVPLEDDKSAAAAWMMMKRGCWPVLVCAGPGGAGAFDLLDKWATNLTLHYMKGPKKLPTGSGPPQEALAPDTPPSIKELTAYAKRKRCEAIVSDQTYAELEKGIPNSEIPVLFPLCGLSDQELNKLADNVRSG